MAFLILSITAAPIFRFSFSVHLFKAHLLESSDWTALTKSWYRPLCFSISSAILNKGCVHFTVNECFYTFTEFIKHLHFIVKKNCTVQEL